MPRTGRPRHSPTAESRLTVEIAAMVGMPHDDICKLIGTGTRQLRRDYREQLTLGKLRANVKIGGKLYQTAMRGNVAALIYWTKTQMGWREPSRIELTGADGGPIAAAQVQAAATDEDAMRTYLTMLKPQENP